MIGQERNNTIEDFQAILNVEAGDRKTLEVFLEYEVEGTATNQAANLTIAPGGVNITLRGQGLPLDEGWDGIIHLSDELDYISISGIGLEELEESLAVSLLVVQSISLSDEINEAEIESLGIVEIDENLSITMVRPTFNLVTESGESFFITEDDHNIITE